jgi:urease subunit gamma/beta
MAPGWSWSAREPGYPGEVLLGPAPAPEWRDATTVQVTNTADVPISVTSHFHFFEVNPRLRFDRAAGYGRHAAIPAGSSIRFEPGQTREVRLVPIEGDRVVIGFAGLVDGPLDAPGARQEALRRAQACGYLSGGDKG